MIRAILTDIEGTTTSLSFVHDVLFPYARTHLREYISRHASETEVGSCLDAINEVTGHALTLEAAIDQLLAWMDEDKKITPLKTLQGLVWDTGYRNRDFTGHVYEDAVMNLRAWAGDGIDLYVFSSGSVPAQKLLFSHSDFGDLTHLFKGYFDTNIGAKRDADSYTKIAVEIGSPAGNTLFLSDIGAELDAAKSAGMKTCQLVRDEETTRARGHAAVASFDEIDLFDL